jgi:RNA polymerase sigma-70 factor (family 1)
LVGSQENKVPFSIKRIDSPKAFEIVYNLYWERVYAVCYTHIRETESAKEMVQDIFKSLWERREELEIDKPIEHYLLRAAKLKVFEYIRNKTIRQKHIACVLQESCSSTNCTEEVVLFNGLVEKVNLLVERLPCQCKRVYKMSREQGMSNKEIASALLISERAVEYHITKAFTFLRRNLPEYQLQ